MSRLLFFCLIVVVGLTGCSALSIDQPIKQERPAKLMLNNSVSTSATFEVSVVQRPADHTVQSVHGNSTAKIDEGIRIHEPRDNQLFSRVELPESARLQGRYLVGPGESDPLPLMTFREISPSSSSSMKTRIILPHMSWSIATASP